MLMLNFQKNQQKLNAQEHEIMKYLIKNIDLIKNKTLKEVSTNLYVSPNTIVRLAKKLDFKGYSELKLAILMNEESVGLVRSDDSLTLKDQLEKTDELLNEEHINQVVQTIKTSQMVYFFACGLSKYPCEEMREKLQMIGIESLVYYEPHVMKQRAKQLKETDVVIVVSLSGETQTPLEAIKIAKMSEAPIVSITGFSQNSLAKLADYSLYVFYEQMTVNHMDVSSRLGIHYVLDSLFEKINQGCVE